MGIERQRAVEIADHDVHALGQVDFGGHPPDPFDPIASGKLGSAELGDLDAVVSVQSELEHVRYMNRRLENVRITVEGDVEGYQELFLKLYDDFLEANGF